MPQFIENSVNGADPIVLKEKVLDPEVTLQPLQRGKPVFIKPHDLEVRKFPKID